MLSCRGGEQLLGAAACWLEEALFTRLHSPPFYGVSQALGLGIHLSYFHVRIVFLFFFLFLSASQGVESSVYQGHVFHVHVSIVLRKNKHPLLLDVPVRVYNLQPFVPLPPLLSRNISSFLPCPVFAHVALNLGVPSSLWLFVLFGGCSSLSELSQHVQDTASNLPSKQRIALGTTIT